MAYDVAGDWGTSRLRLTRLVNGRAVDHAEGPGISRLTLSPEETLREALAPLWAEEAPRAIRLCGMIGSRNGWRDVPYVECPADPAAWAAGAERLALDDVPVSIAAGLACTDAAGVPDVMRGEETQIFGACALEPALAQGRHLISLPGTHNKWAMVEDGRIVTFRTYFTGELFALLRDQSTLGRLGHGDDAAEEHAGFGDGLARAEAGVGLLGSLFEARAAQLRAGRTPSWAMGFLSGLLIGSELGELMGTLGTAETILLIGDPGLAGRYQVGLRRRGHSSRILDGDACALAGLALLEHQP